MTEPQERTDPTPAHPIPTEGDYAGPIRITLTRPDTGEELTSAVIADDYALITTGRCYVKSKQVWPKSGTTQIVIAYDPEDAP
jgi:hypothetical protein